MNRGAKLKQTTTAGTLILGILPILFSLTIEPGDRPLWLYANVSSFTLYSLSIYV